MSDRTYDQQGYIIGESTHYVQFGLVKLTLRHAPRLNEMPQFVGSEDGLDMLCCEHCMEAPGHATRVDGVSQADHVKSPKRGDMWRTSDGCVCLVVDSVGYSNKYDASRVFFWRRGKLDNCEPSDFGLVLTSLNAASVDCPEKEGA